MSHCVCGHPEEAHLFGGRCRVPGCTCDRFWPIPEISAQMWSQLMRIRGIQHGHSDCIKSLSKWQKLSDRMTAKVVPMPSSRDVVLGHVKGETPASVSGCG